MAVPRLPPFVTGGRRARRLRRLASCTEAGRAPWINGPFILHPLEDAALFERRGFDDEVVALGLLHDAVEDTAYAWRTSGYGSAIGSPGSWPT